MRGAKAGLHLVLELPAGSAEPAPGLSDSNRDALAWAVQTVIGRSRPYVHV
jgi:hypothetical protein